MLHGIYILPCIEIDTLMLTVTSSMVDKKECETAVHECNSEQAEDG